MKIDNKTLLERSVAEVIVRKELEAKLKKGKPLNVKLGIDPSGADLHLGHMVVIKKLREFQLAGHKVFLLFGNFTGQIGDPTDKLNARQPKSQKELEANAKKYVDQVSKILDTSKIEVVWNADWLGKLSFADVVKLAQSFTVHQMLERDMYQKRIKEDKPIYMHEFLYPLMQGYDSVALKADLELGGTDQTFNLLAGRTIQRAYGQEPQSVLTVPLLVGTDGKEKMGKSLGNYIGIDESPKDMFGKTMSIPDNLILNYFELTTDVSIDELKKIEKALKAGENPRNLKVRLAKELVKFYHSAKEADEAEQEFINMFQKKELPDVIEEKKLDQSKWKLVDLLAETRMVSSRGEGRRLIEQGGVKIDQEKVLSVNTEVNISEKKLLQVGKRKWLKAEAWESYIGKVISNLNLNVTPNLNQEGPDFIVNNKIYIECTAVTKGELGKPDSVPEMYYAKNINEMIVQDVPTEKMIFRITNALKNKVEQYKNWQTKEWFNPEAPYVIAINTNDLEFPQDYLGIPLAIKALFGLQYMTINSNLQSSFSFIKEINKGTNKVPVNYFTNEKYNFISGIIYLDKNPQYSEIEDCIFINNPFAKHNVDNKFKKSFKNWVADKNKQGIMLTKKY